jgi:hypothetical protein
MENKDVLRTSYKNKQGKTVVVATNLEGDSIEFFTRKN